VREAVLNALIHRDYSFYTEGTPIQINFFSDRLEIHSPGSLYGRMTVEQLGYAKMDLRNPALAVMAEVLTGAENRYSGIPTMRREMAAYGLPAPEFENRRNEFVVIFRNGTDQSGEARNTAEQNEAGQKTVGPNRAEQDVPRENVTEALLAFCAAPRTRQEIADFLRVKTAFYAMRRYVQPLVEEGKLALTLPDHPKSRNQRYYAK
ncbi:MAG: AAA family ATPase, partial [Oscillibacter sp.]|nr:AAA family ATPase [Oscillibacter sp.]